MIKLSQKYICFNKPQLVQKVLTMVIYLILLLIHNVLGQDGPIVDTEYGQVQGVTLELHNGISVNSFYGIPYAEPPLGELRFLDPVAVQVPWDDVLPAVELPPSCVQSGGGFWLVTHPLWRNFQEDCLNLNVFTPSATEGQSYPVMVWLHGGGYQSSGNIQYPGHFLAMKDVVVVVPNYRLGHLGFAYTGDENAPGNAGMKDQLMALQWVQENIVNFGGDPNQVTIFGESAGGASTGLMLMSPMATGLFQGAILESGTEMTVWAVNVPESQPEDYTRQVAEQLGCPVDDNALMMDCLREVPADELIDTSFNCTAGYVCLGMAPVVDGPNGFLPDIPRVLRLNDEYNQVPEIVMHNSEDAMLFLLALIFDDRWNVSAGFSREEFNEILELTTTFFTPILPDPDRAEDIFEAMSWFYAPWPYINDLEMNRHQLGMLLTDAAFSVADDLQAKDNSEDATTYYMIFGYRSDEWLIPEWLGTFHAMELPYVFGLPYLPFNDQVRNNSGIRIDPVDYNSEDREYFEFVGDMWTNFAKTGNPTPYPVLAPGGKGEITWNNLTRDNLAYLNVDNDVIEMTKDYRQSELAFWREYLRCMNFADLTFPGTDTSCENPISGRIQRRKKNSENNQNGFNPFKMSEKINNLLEKFFSSYNFEE